MAISFPGIYNFTVFVDYQWDMDSYIERCENRDVPMMNCNGKCLLAQKIKQANEDDRPEAPTFLSEISSYLQTEGVEVNTPFQSVSSVQWEGLIYSPRSWLNEVFHPPLV